MGGLTVEDLLVDHQLYHSENQMDWFITARSGGLTPYGQYKQALRELHGRHRGLKDLGFQRELLLLEIEELQCSDGNYFQTKKNEIILKQKKFSLLELDRNIADTKRELDHFYGQALRLKEVVGDLTPEKRKQLDCEMWIVNIKVQAAVDCLIRGGLGESVLTMLMSIPSHIRNPILKEVMQPKEKLIAWLEKQEPLMLEANA